MKALNSITLIMLLVAGNLSAATTYEWTFDAGNLATALGNGTMTYSDAATSSLVSFATTNGSSVPHIGGTPAKYISVPSLTGTTNGLHLTFGDSGPNGGGAYLNQYSIVMDIYSPGAAGWQALFNTQPANSSGNDADWYIDPTGKLGIGNLGYSSNSVIAQNTWNRVAFVADLGAGVVKYYVNGIQVFSRTGASLLDGRYAIFSNADAGVDLLLFNEGDTSGVYTHQLFVNSVGFRDVTLTDSQVAALGGANANGIFAVVPEPSRFCFLALGVLTLGLRRRR